MRSCVLLTVCLAAVWAGPTQHVGVPKFLTFREELIKAEPSPTAATPVPTTLPSTPSSAVSETPTTEEPAAVLVKKEGASDTVAIKTNNPFFSVPLESTSTNITKEQMGVLDEPCIEEGSTIGSDGMILRPNAEPTSRFPLPPITDFNILTWNVFARPGFVFDDAQATRMNLMVDGLFAVTPENELDAIVLEGLHDAVSRKIVLDAFANRISGWRYHTDSLGYSQGLSSVVFTGGVVVVSRWPIEYQSQLFFRCKTGGDAVYRKGVIFTRIAKMQNGRNKRFNVFATEMQMSLGTSMREKEAELKTRLCQAEEIGTFITSQGIPKSDPVFITGTFNVDFLDAAAPFTNEITNVLVKLSTTMPTIGGPEFSTYDVSRHDLAGRDGRADQYGCGAECELMYNCTCIPPMWLEYILISKEFQQPISASSMYTIDVEVPEFTAKMTKGSDPSIPTKIVERKLTRLSSHDPVVRFFRFLH